MRRVWEGIDAMGGLGDRLKFSLVRSRQEGNKDEDGKKHAGEKATTQDPNGDMGRPMHDLLETAVTKLKCIQNLANKIPQISCKT